ncbi:MAG: TetR/AcrR family transcriptional regulator [Betaproteobacteria bacterium]
MRIKPSSRRARGRPARVPERDAREALLDAAVALFAERGVAATTAAGIASRAGVTPAMVHYYFRGRERLLDAVVDERMSRFVANVFGAPLDPAAPIATAIATIAGRIFDTARMMPWMPRIWIREIAAEGGLLRERAIKHLPLAAVDGLVARVQAAQRRGEIAAGIEPRIVLVSMLGLTLFPLATEPLWRRLPGADKLTPADLQRHATALLTAGLAGATAAPPGAKRVRAPHATARSRRRAAAPRHRKHA